MKRILFSLLLVVTAVIVSATALAQDMSERIYPSQYASLDA